MIASTNDRILQITMFIRIGECFVAVCLHMLGFLALYSYKKKNNQGLILFSLSLAEILILPTVLIKELTIIKLRLPWPGAMRGLLTGFMMQLILVMLILISDRFICVLNPLKYSARITRSNLRAFFTISWIISILFGIAMAVYPDKSEIAIESVGVVLIGLFLVLSIITYSMILIFTQRRRVLLQRVSAQHRYREFFIPGLLILTFILSYAIPYPLQRFASNRSDTMVRIHLTTTNIRACQILMTFGLILDPLTYIFLSKRYKKSLLKLFIKLMERGRRLDNEESNVVSLNRQKCYII